MSVAMGSFSDEFQETILPVVVCFMIYNIVGFVENSTVLFVYGFRYPRNRFRSLVIALALVDITSCCSTVPMETVSTWFWFDSPSTVLCKVKNFFVQFTGLSAMYMLFVTAVCKYRKICKPFGRQLNNKWIIVLSSCGVFGSFVCAIPAAILWGINSHNVTFNNKTEAVQVCEVLTQFHGQKYPELYRHLLSAYDIFLLGTIVLYIFVARATILHVRKIKKMQKSPGGLCISKSCSVTFNSSYMYRSRDTGTPTENSQDLTTDNTVDTERQTTLREAISTKLRVTTRYSRSYPGPISVRRVLIMVVIAGTFSITFLMSLTFGYVFAIRNYGDYGSVSELVILFVCYRFYFINYAMNSVVYFALDTCFRREVLKLIRCWKC